MEKENDNYFRAYIKREHLPFSPYKDCMDEAAAIEQIKQELIEYAISQDICRDKKNYSYEDQLALYHGREETNDIIMESRRHENQRMINDNINVVPNSDIEYEDRKPKCLHPKESVIVWASYLKCEKCNRLLIRWGE